MATNTMVALQTQVLGSSASSVTFSSIPQGYTDLVLIADLSMASPSGTCYLVGRVGNGSIDTGSNYSSTAIVGNGSSASSYRTGTVNYFQFDTYLTGSNRAMLNSSFQNYSNTTTYKTILGRTSSAATNASAIVSKWNSTSAINTITVYDYSGNSFAAGSTFTLYGIANADIGAYATGGIITYDANYYYHAFAASGTFTPKQALTADILVVAGGGGGGNWTGGGGGAGGVLGFAAQALTSGTAYTCTVGSGGTAATHAAAGTNGGNSSFGSISGTVYGGGAGGNYSPVVAPASGGSGGGGDSGNSPLTGASGTSGQGYAGGSANAAPYYNGGGGGGAGGVGGNAGTGGGNGGTGINSLAAFANLTTALSVTGFGVSGYIAGGGGGGANGSSIGTTNGGGGLGSASGASNAQNGIANTGGGGGGSGWDSTNGPSYAGAGGSGLIIVRYAK